MGLASRKWCAMPSCTSAGSRDVGGITLCRTHTEAALDVVADALGIMRRSTKMDCRHTYACDCDTIAVEAGMS